MWLSEECEKKYRRSSTVECGFSVFADWLRGKRNQLEINKSGDLRLKLTKVEPGIKLICNQHQAHSSHLAMILSIAINLSKLCTFIIHIT